MKKMQTGLLLLLLAALPWASSSAQEPTRVMIRVVATDGKIIGSDAGGVKITIRNAFTDDDILEGVQEGSSGDTEAIMGPRERGEPVYEGGGGFLAELPLRAPTLIEVTAEGPLGPPAAGLSAQRSFWVVPGHHVLGDGIVLELTGLTVELVDVGNAVEVAEGEDVEISAIVRTLDGSTTEPGGLWDASRYDILLRVVNGAEVLSEAPMRYDTVSDTFTGSVTPPRRGTFLVEVLAIDTATGNVGKAHRTLRVRNER